MLIGGQPSFKKEVKFTKKVEVNNGVSFEMQFDPEADSYKHFRDVLKHTFISGRELAVTVFENEGHAFVAALSKDGTFKIIDSMSGGKVHNKHFEKMVEDLNACGIKDDKGKTIEFKYEIVKTKLQRLGDSYNECTFYANLFAYQMLKENAIDAYKKVLGAFSAGVLKTFSDIDKISDCDPKDDGSDIRFKEKVKPFINDLLHKYVFGVGDWKQCPLENLDGNVIYALKNGKIITAQKIISSFSNIDQYKIKQNDGSYTTINSEKDNTQNKTTIGDMIPDEGKVTYFYIDESGKPVARTVDEGCGMYIFEQDGDNPVQRTRKKVTKDWKILDEFQDV